MELGKGSKGSRNRNLLSTKSFFELLPSLLALGIHFPHSKGNFPWRTTPGVPLEGNCADLVPNHGEQKCWDVGNHSATRWS